MINKFSPFYPLYLWTQRALPLVISGDLEIIDLVRHLMTSIAEIGDITVEAGDINYTTIVQQLIDNEEFYQQFQDIINNYIGGKEGLGNLIGYYTHTSYGYSIGTCFADEVARRLKTVYLYDADNKGIGSTSSTLSMTNIGGLVFFTFQIAIVSASLTTSYFPDGAFECKVAPFITSAGTVFTDDLVDKVYDFFGHDPDVPVYSMPYGDSDNYFIVHFRPKADVLADRDAYDDTKRYLPLLKLYSSGQAIRSLPLDKGQTSVSTYAYATLATTYYSTTDAHLKVSNVEIIDLLNTFTG